ncbi:MAG: MFS transporter, partial [Methylocella sp.]
MKNHAPVERPGITGGPSLVMLANGRRFRKVDAWVTVFILLSFNVLGYADRTVITMLVGPIKSDLAVSDIQMSLLMGFAFALLYATCGLPMGVIADRVSRRRLIFFGVFGWSAMMAACGLAANFTQLILGRAGVGVGEAVLAPAAQALIAEKFPREQFTIAMSVFMVGAVVGAGLAAMVGGTLVQAVLIRGATVLPLIGAVRPWQFVFVCLGIAGLVLAPLMFFVGEQRPTSGSAPVHVKASIGVRALLSLV